MRSIVAILAFPMGSLAALCFAAALTKGGSDLQLIAGGIFATALMVCLCGVGIMARLEEIRDRTKKEI